MKYTSAEAAKLLRKLNEEHDALLALEQESREFLAASTEDPASVRPEYDYPAVQNELQALETKIRRVKHCINQFNITHQVPGFDMAVDQMLVYIPQLTARREKLRRMKGLLPKQRQEHYGSSNIIDYRYANYDIAQAKADYDQAADTLARAQTALDLLNSTQTMDIDL